MNEEFPSCDPRSVPAGGAKEEVSRRSSAFGTVDRRVRDERGGVGRWVA